MRGKRARRLRRRLVRLYLRVHEEGMEHYQRKGDIRGLELAVAALGGAVNVAGMNDPTVIDQIVERYGSWASTVSDHRTREVLDQVSKIAES